MTIGAVKDLFDQSSDHESQNAKAGQRQKARNERKKSDSSKGGVVDFVTSWAETNYSCVSLEVTPDHSNKFVI